MTKLKRTTEDYLKTIFLLSKQSGGVRSVRIAEYLGVSKPTVCVVLKRMTANDFVYMDGDYEIHLTDTGKELAEQITERHRTITELLSDLGVDKEIAARDACEIEHGVSTQTYEVLKKLAASRKGAEA